MFGLFGKRMSDAEKMQHRWSWFKINAPVGQMCGYPACCIKEFCDDAPEILKALRSDSGRRLRYEASLVDGKYTGFIPCYGHALQIVSGKITLVSLVTNRDPALPPFPEYGNHE